jgi:hypothetical protein
MSLILGINQVRVRHLPEDIVQQAPWGDAILIGEVIEIGADVKDIEIGNNVTFARQDGRLVNEGETEESWVVSVENILEYDPGEE